MRQKTPDILGMHWVQSPRSVAKFLHVVMMTLSNLGDPETAILEECRALWGEPEDCKAIRDHENVDEFD